MTRDELLFLQKHLAAAGWSADQLVALAEAERAWRIDRACERAVRRALSVPVAAVQQGQVVPVSAATTAAPVPVSAAIGRKHAARKALLMAPGIAPQDKAILAALVDRADAETGRCWPSRRTIARDAGVGGEQPERAVLRAIVNARGDGLLRWTSGGGRGRATCYVVDWAAFAELLAQCEGRSSAPFPMRAAMGRLKRGQALSGNGDKGDKAVPPTREENTSAVPLERVERARAEVAELPRPAAAASVRAGARRTAPRPDPAQPQMPLPIPGGRSGEQVASDVLRALMDRNTGPPRRRTGTG